MVILKNFHSPFQSDPYYSNNLDKAPDTYSNYDRVSLAGDFNAEICPSTLLVKHVLPSDIEELFIKIWIL